ncbi:MAG: fumarylacetoacetate hydrolase family protein, partial [Chitinophagaceae bacterium]
MKIFRFDKSGSVGLGMLDAKGKKIDISGYYNDFNRSFFEMGGTTHLSEWLLLHANECDEIKDEVTFLPCIADPSKIICVGLNYAKHAKESNMEVPKEPVLFFKSTSAICGPNDPVII